MSQTFPFEFTVGSSIEFKNNTGINPLMPLVQANYSELKNVIQISVNIFINKEVKMDQDSISIIQDAQNQFLFFIEYTKDVLSNSAKIFTNYRLDFEVENLNADNNHGEIVVYLKDEDPTLSRGTVTTVQHTK
jgi:hypothetical protein